MFFSSSFLSEVCKPGYTFFYTAVFDSGGDHSKRLSCETTPICASQNAQTSLLNISKKPSFGECTSLELPRTTIITPNKNDFKSIEIFYAERITTRLNGALRIELSTLRRETFFMIVRELEEAHLSRTRRRPRDLIRKDLYSSKITANRYVPKPLLVDQFLCERFQLDLWLLL